MKRYFVLGLTALGLIALSPTQSKADDGSRVYVNPGYHKTDLTTMMGTATATIIVTATNIDGLGTIIGTTTIEIMTGTTTAIDFSRFSLGSESSSM
jgi:hypothetical protein